MDAYLADLAASLANGFLDPQKRVFIGYLASAWLIALVWLVWFRRNSLSGALRQVFSRRVWLSASARADYLILVTNRIVLSAIAPRLLSQLVIATAVFEGLHYGFSPGSGPVLPEWIIGLLFTVTVFLLDDGSRYLVHRAMHESRLLWCFHRVHHTASTLTPLTIFRTHPVEGVLFLLRSALVQGVAIGAFVFAFGSGVDLVTVLGANLFIFLFNALGANLRHSTVPLYYPRVVERWLMSPAQHQIHHSSNPAHFDTNYGVFLSVWDRLGGTLRHSEPGVSIDFGVCDHAGDVEHRLRSLYLQPMLAAGRIIAGRCAQVPQKVCVTRSSGAGGSA